ncbi:MAG: hypothetical protein ACI8UO_002639, partial [Verrucomicrobiales bacterium]
MDVSMMRTRWGGGLTQSKTGRTMPNLLTKKTVSGTRLTYDVQMVDADGS